MSRSGRRHSRADFNPADNTDHASLVVNPQADLSLTKTVSNANPGTDDEVQYTLTANNAGPNDATGVTIHDSLPAGLDFIDASPGCDNDNGTVTCDVGTLASGDSASVTIKARTTAALAGAAVGNLATVSGNELDPNPSNNQATRDDQRPAARRPQADQGRLEPVAGRRWPGQLHADAGQQRAEPRDWRDDHRPASQRALVPIGERRARQLRRLGSDGHMPARHARRGWRGDRDDHRRRSPPSALGTS